MSMRASKENARAALEKMTKAVLTEEDVGFVRDFLEAAIRKLPSEAAFDKESNKDAVRKAAEKGFSDGNRG